MQLFSGDATIFSKKNLDFFLPMKTWKNCPQKFHTYGILDFFSLQPWLPKTAQNWIVDQDTSFYFHRVDLNPSVLCYIFFLKKDKNYHLFCVSWSTIDTLSRTIELLHTTMHQCFHIIAWLLGDVFRFLPYLWFGCFLYISLP